MKKRFKGIQIFLVIAISFSALVSSTYYEYYTLAAADFIAVNLKLEAFDQDYLSAANQNEWKSSRLGSFSQDFQLAPLLFGLPSHLPFRVRSLDQKTLVLRC